MGLDVGVLCGLCGGWLWLWYLVDMNACVFITIVRVCFGLVGWLTLFVVCCLIFIGCCFGGVPWVGVVLGWLWLGVVDLGFVVGLFVGLGWGCLGFGWVGLGVGGSVCTGFVCFVY